MKKRITASLPTRATYCHIKLSKDCPYRDQQLLCDDPRTNKGNSDARCHKLSNGAVMAFLSDRQDGPRAALTTNSEGKP